MSAAGFDCFDMQVSAQDVTALICKKVTHLRFCSAGADFVTKAQKFFNAITAYTT